MISQPVRRARLFQSWSIDDVNQQLSSWLRENTGKIADVDYSFKTQELHGPKYPDGSQNPSTCMTTLLVEYYLVEEE